MGSLVFRMLFHVVIPEFSYPANYIVTAPPNYDIVMTSVFYQTGRLCYLSP